MFGSRIQITGAVLALLAGAPLAPRAVVRAAPPDPGERPGALYLLDPQGRVMRWDAGRPGLEMVTAVGGSVKALTAVGSGRLLILPVMTDEEAGHRRPRGAAVLYDTARGTGERAVLETRFEGEGYAVAAHEASGLAYVLALVSRPQGADPGRAWLHAIDLEDGRLVDSAALPEPPNGIAVSPRDGRVFLALINRLLTYSSSPLASSWQYRSPGLNLALGFQPGSDLLFVVRVNEIALFDPVVIARRTSSERLALRDDATLTIGLPLQAAEIAFPDESLPLLAAFGHSGPVVFVDWRAGAVLGTPEAPGALHGAELIHYLPRAAASGDAIAFAALPAGRVVEVTVPRPLDAPPPSGPPPAAAAEPTTTVSTATEPRTAPLPDSGAVPAAGSAPSAERPGAPAPDPGRQTPAPEAVPVDDRPALPAPQATSPTALARPGGRLTGRRDLVAAIVIFGPGSIVREQARAVPDDHGLWEVETPPAGVYRIVPIGIGGGPLLARPNFHTMPVPAGIGPSYDFDILGAP